MVTARKRNESGLRKENKRILLNPRENVRFWVLLHGYRLIILRYEAGALYKSTQNKLDWRIDGYGKNKLGIVSYSQLNERYATMQCRAIL